MAMSYVASASNGAATGATSLAVNKPTGTTTGDVMLAVMISNNTSFTAPAGWTQLQTVDASTGAAYRGYLFYKVVPSSDSGVTSYTFSHPDNQAPLLGHITTIRGCDTGSPIMDSASIATGATASNVDPAPNISVNRTNAPSRALYWRAVRTNTSTTPGTFTESSGGWDLATPQQTAGTGTVRYGVAAAYTGDFASLGSTEEPTGGVLVPTAVTDSIHFMVQLFGAPEGTMTPTLPAADAAMAGDHRISGTLGTQLPAAQALFTGAATPPSGTIDTSLPAASASLAGNTPVLGSMDMTILPSVSFSAETRQFGEHVIRVEPEHRAFLVVDDGTDVGLKAIKRSKVTEQ